MPWILKHLFREVKLKSPELHDSSSILVTIKLFSELGNSFIAGNIDLGPITLGLSGH